MKDMREFAINCKLLVPKLKMEPQFIYELRECRCLKKIAPIYKKVRRYERRAKVTTKKFLSLRKPLKIKEYIVDNEKKNNGLAICTPAFNYSNVMDITTLNAESEKFSEKVIIFEALCRYIMDKAKQSAKEKFFTDILMVAKSKKDKNVVIISNGKIPKDKYGSLLHKHVLDKKVKTCKGKGYELLIFSTKEKKENLVNLSTEIYIKKSSIDFKFIR